MAWNFTEILGSKGENSSEYFVMVEIFFLVLDFCFSTVEDTSTLWQ